MKIDILTLFPEMFTPLQSSIIGRARKDNKIQINIIDIREFSKDAHKKCDDYPFGGGSGMVMMIQPIADAIEFLDSEHKALRIFMSPQGKVLKQEYAVSLTQREHIIILCGHYEGVDQRVIDLFIDEEISVGDYVLTGGELPAMVLTDCLARYVDGVLSNGSLVDESFTENLLEYPQYTRPSDYNGCKVPDVLLSGNHGEIAKWRREKAIEVTKAKRPDLL